jgi:hypothetical protein
MGRNRPVRQCGIFSRDHGDGGRADIEAGHTFRRLMQARCLAFLHQLAEPAISTVDLAPEHPNVFGAGGQHLAVPHDGGQGRLVARNAILTTISGLAEPAHARAWSQLRPSAAEALAPPRLRSIPSIASRPSCSLIATSVRPCSSLTSSQRLHGPWLRPAKLVSADAQTVSLGARYDRCQAFIF